VFLQFIGGKTRFTWKDKKVQNKTFCENSKSSSQNSTVLYQATFFQKWYKYTGN